MTKRNESRLVWLLPSCLLVVGFWMWEAPQAAGAADDRKAARSPTPTPTSRPKLTGGFGRPAVTPVPPQSDDQSLSGAVKASESRRKDQKPNVAITNETLVTDPKKGNLTTSHSKTLPTPVPTAAAEPAAKPSPIPAVEAVGGESEWREKARSLRKRVEDGKARVYQLEGEAAALEKDFYRWDDGQYRDGIIKPAWDKKKEELEAAHKELEQAEKDLADLPDQARKAGALPGWIRE